MRSVLIVIVAYLLGSIPFGYLVVRMGGGGDVRETGSGGTGATNVSRRAGKAAGVLTLVLDALKGAIAVLIATRLSEGWLVAIAAVAVVVGHVFPVWLGFRGGKGVATAVGVFFVLAPFALVCAGIVFVAVVSLTRYVSLASLSAAVSIPLFLWLLKLFIEPRAEIKAPLTAAVVVGLLIIFAHRANIARLVAGTEPKFR